jgi:hypothetical protein
MLKRLRRTAVTTIALSVVGTAAIAAQQMQHPQGQERTITGRVVDTSCLFGQGLSGNDHRMCAQVCAGRGVALAILGTDSTLYLPTSPAMPGDGQNDRLKDFAEQEVTVTGRVFPAGGARVIQIATIRRKG